MIYWKHQYSKMGYIIYLNIHYFWWYSYGGSLISFIKILIKYNIHNLKNKCLILIFALGHYWDYFYGFKYNMNGISQTMGDNIMCTSITLNILFILSTTFSKKTNIGLVLILAMHLLTTTPTMDKYPVITYHQISNKVI